MILKILKTVHKPVSIDPAWFCRDARRWFVLDPTESFSAFATPRTHPDDSSFNINQSIVDVWVADDEYVEIAS